MYTIIIISCIRTLLVTFFIGRIQPISLSYTIVYPVSLITVSVKGLATSLLVD